AASGWPSTGPVPWLIDFEAPTHHAHDADHADARDYDAGASHRDASDIPGSPTHPDDHNCFQCEVIKHLARCVPAAISVPVVAIAAGNTPTPLFDVVALHAAFVAPAPPIRAPPRSRA